MKRLLTYTILSLAVLLNLSVKAQDYLTVDELTTQKQEAVNNSQYRLAKVIQTEIESRSTDSIKKTDELIALEQKTRDAVAKQDWLLAHAYKRQRNSLLGIKEKITGLSAGYATNKREIAFQEMKNQDFATANSLIPTSANPEIIISEEATQTKVKNATENDIAKELKYRRSSLYTLMINDLTREYSGVIKDAFGNSTVPQKFNDHNIGPYLVNGVANSDDQTQVITTYLTNNNVAKDLVAKWFNRSNDGKFNMDLISSRGMYDATAMDKVVANASERGSALLADAGEELIGNTFVIVNDYKFTNKEEAVAKGKKASGFAKMAAGYIPGAGAAIQKGITAAEAAATVAGKGYWVRTTSYLYRLVWDEEAAAIFYNNYWTDVNNFDLSKVEAFNNANNFKLKLIGSQTAGADVQSSIFTNKSEEDLIRMATVKATDRAIAKLEKKYEEFRTKTPLISIEPLAAKIGTKEGLEKGDKYEVINQIETPEGKTIYKRVGIITVATVWDNSYSPEEEEELKKQGKLPEQQYSIFKGSGKYYPGMLIKQIN
ncbi:hypothetical protein FRY74_06855 [Vicingus serpentipes]|uniref:Uncharacterized protein n=1 Tax=Vicingus serpentipes TaxID=1926625 RepID=A0A5C6RS05_9FLAO|nr:hypothetical protein [Vicingus serpentipes]TXB65141.1 hypothetical protein FRY74_06855 [Vicingus serpentipes]